MRRLAFAFGVAAVVTTATASAHHSFAAEFDAQRPVKLQGTVIKMEWINPHPWIHIDVKGPDGRSVVWMIETSAPNALIRRGFTKNSLPPGSVITVDGYQARDGSNRANGRELAFADGRKLFLSSVGTGGPDDTPAPSKE